MNSRSYTFLHFINHYLVWSR